MTTKKQNPLPKCIVCKKDKLHKINKIEVLCGNCKSQYSIEWLTKVTKGSK